MAKEKMCEGGPCDAAEMTGPRMHTSPHKRGTGGAGGSPVKFRKREGGLEDKRVVHGMNCKD